MHGEEGVKPSWADEVELEGTLPAPTEVFENGLKVVTEYKWDGERKIQIVRTYKIEKRLVPKSIALRKTWNKFGECSGDKCGPNPATTIIGEDVFMQFVSSKEEDNNKPEDDGIDKLKSAGVKNAFKCRNCGGDHWTTKCPWKDTIFGGGKMPDDKKPAAQPSGAQTAQAEPNKTASKYIAPSLRDGEKKSEGFNMGRRDDNYCAIRISNISDSTTEADLEELVKPFGPIHKLYLAKDKQTGNCKGFAYIHFKFKSDAAKAIMRLNGHGYDHLILAVDWSKPMNSN